MKDSRDEFLVPEILIMSGDGLPVKEAGERYTT